MTLPFKHILQFGDVCVALLDIFLWPVGSNIKVSFVNYQIYIRILLFQNCSDSEIGRLDWGT